MTLAHIRDYLKTVAGAEHYYIGRRDGKQDKSLGVYPLKRPGYPVAVGGREATGVGMKPVSILLHWTKNADETERAAQKLYDQLLNAKDAVIGGRRVYYCKPLVPEPVDVGTEGNVFEYVLEYEIYYERNDLNA